MNEQRVAPLSISQSIQQDYERYIETAFPIQNASLSNQFRTLVRQHRFLVRGPYLEATPPFEKGRTIREMMAAGILCQGAVELDGPGFPKYGYPIDRKLYKHQEEAIAKVRMRRNVVVATGTGSGKTEAFLLPIIDYLLREREAGTLKRPGVRALFLYPMNALANDQLKRLRRLLQRVPEITFGRYTGQTSEYQDAAEQEFRRVFPQEPRIENELISREAIRAFPPHILLTNYAMLEYLLLRPKDTPLFDGDFGGCWQFIVVDEAHGYSGAAGMEVGMLLRRLKYRVVRSKPGSLRCIATSATLGGGRNDFRRVAEFATALFGEAFEYDEQDKERQDIIGPSIQDEALSASEIWGKPEPEFYNMLQAHLGEIQTIAELAPKYGVPQKVVNQALINSDNSCDAFLYHVLQGDIRVQALKLLLKNKPTLLASAATAKDIFGINEPTSVSTLVCLVSLCSIAKTSGDSSPLISARYHLFCRALEGAFVTFPIKNEPRLHIRPIDQIREDGILCQAFEIATCSRCGHTVLTGVIEDHLITEDGTVVPGEYVRPRVTSDRDISERKAFFSWDILPEGIVDEDEAVLADAQPVPLVANRGALCASCGAYTRGTNEKLCQCPPERQIIVYEYPLREGRLATCPACGAQTPYEDIVHRFYTGQDAPVAVIASSLYQHLPPAPSSGLPGGNRKLLTFADSRQDAAYFAPYLEATHRAFLQRRLINQALNLNQGKFGSAPARPHGLAETFLQHLTRNLNIFPAPSDVAYENKERCSWIFQELLAFDRRLSLEGTGLLIVRYTKPTEWKVPPSLLQSPWNFEEEEVWNVVEVLLDTLRFSGCLSVEPADIKAAEFEPRNRLVYCRETGADQVRGVTILGWLPRKDIRPQVTNRRFNYLSRLSKKRTTNSHAIQDTDVMKFMREIWRAITVTPLMKAVMLDDQRLGVAYHINPNYVELRPPIPGEKQWWRCSSCHSVSAIAVNGICPTMRCEGSMRLFDPENELADNHYRCLYLGMIPIPMAVSEHTAQWGARKAADIQQRFMDGTVNVLSCSTTFELGVDVGDLQAVLMRNVPPTTANYVQRAGRAGRRSGAAAFAITYAQRRPHDLTHFEKPEEFISGKIKPPAVEIRNSKIVRRHVHSVTLAEFFRQHPEKFESVESFFCNDVGGNNAPILLSKMLAVKPVSLLKSLIFIVPTDPDVRTDLLLEEWGWVPNLINIENGSYGGVLGEAATEVLTDLAVYEQLKAEASAAENYSRASALKRQANNIRKQEILGFLASRNVLPKYGFPVDVVELRLKPTSDIAQELELTRDLKVAISEYAPGGEVVAGHQAWTSTGIRRLPGRDPREFAYSVCRQCGRFHKDIQYDSLPKSCQACGEAMRGRGFRSGILVEPKFGFFSSKDPYPVGRGRPKRLYSSRIFFSEHATTTTDEDFHHFPESQRDKTLPFLLYRFSRQGKLAVINSGMINRGFLVCQTCGYAEPAPLKPQKHKKNHQNAFDKSCSGILEIRHLGHEFLTDVLELRFSTKLPPDPERSLWWSLLYALLQGASEVLGIERDDIDGCLYPYGDRNLPPAIVLFDSIPGGAGHVRRIGDNLNEILKETYRFTASCPSCDENTSCYACLKTYDNQFCQNLLRRGSVFRFLDDLKAIAEIH